MADNASAPENPPHDSTKDSVPDPGLPTPAASLGPDEERNRADQQRRAAESSKATDEGVVPNTAGKTEASEQGGALPNQGTTGPAEQGVASVSTSQATAGSAAQGATPDIINQVSKPKRKNDAGPSRKWVAGQSNRIGKSKDGSRSEKKSQLAVDRVLRCDAADGYKILDVDPTTEKSQISNAVKRLLYLTSPKRLSDPDQRTLKRAEDAHERA